MVSKTTCIADPIRPAHRIHQGRESGSRPLRIVDP
jgi:hypothetical protein